MPGLVLAIIILSQLYPSLSLELTLCAGELSYPTVYNQRCLARADGRSSCKMGSEGFSFCDTEHVWWRWVLARHWVYISTTMIIGMITGMTGTCALSVPRPILPYVSAMMIFILLYGGKF
jgi:hypothetical protein